MIPTYVGWVLIVVCTCILKHFKARQGNIDTGPAGPRLFQISSKSLSLPCASPGLSPLLLCMFLGTAEKEKYLQVRGSGGIHEFSSSKQVYEREE
jgi:hypothetical protein